MLITCREGRSKVVQRIEPASVVFHPNVRLMERAECFTEGCCGCAGYTSHLSRKSFHALECVQTPGNGRRRPWLRVRLPGIRTRIKLPCSIRLTPNYCLFKRSPCWRRLSHFGSSCLVTESKLLVVAAKRTLQSSGHCPRS